MKPLKRTSRSRFIKVINVTLPEHAAHSRSCKLCENIHLLTTKAQMSSLLQTLISEDIFYNNSNMYKTLLFYVNPLTSILRSFSQWLRIIFNKSKYLYHPLKVSNFKNATKSYFKVTQLVFLTGVSSFETIAKHNTIWNNSINIIICTTTHHIKLRKISLNSNL